MAMAVSQVSQCVRADAVTVVLESDN